MEKEKLVPWVQENISPYIKEDFVSLARTCEHVRASVHHKQYGNSTWAQDIPEDVLVACENIQLTLYYVGIQSDDRLVSLLSSDTFNSFFSFADQKIKHNEHKNHAQTVHTHNQDMEFTRVPTFSFFSGHEGSTVALLRALGQPDPTNVIPFSSMVLFELRSENIDGHREYFVRVSYNKNYLDLSGVCIVTGHDFYQCPYHEFKLRLMSTFVLPGFSDDYCINDKQAF